MNTSQIVARYHRRGVLLDIRDDSLTARTVFHYSLEPISSTQACAHLFALASQRTAAQSLYRALCRRHRS